LTVTVWDWKSCVSALILAGVAFADAAAPLPDGAGKKVVETACTSCHGLDLITSKKLTRQRWQVLVLAMGSPSLTKAESAEAVEYLAKNFGGHATPRPLRAMPSKAMSPPPTFSAF
jgi:cytochrome c5